MSIALHQIRANSSSPKATVPELSSPGPPPMASALSPTSVPPQPLSKHEVDKKPWKHVGYRGYVDLLSSDDDFLIFRRFTAANVRVGLALQDRVSVFEERLAELDDIYSRREAENVHNGSFRQDQPDRLQVIGELYRNLKEYNEFIIQLATLKKHSKAFKHDIESLRTWHRNHNEAAILPEEQSYLSYPADLFSVVPQERTSLRRFFDRSRLFRDSPFWEKRSSQVPVYDQDEVTLFSDKRVERFISFLIVSIGFVMLIAPMWILYALSSGLQKMGTITGFVVLFLALVASATTAKPLEALAATAAYSAVLVVFLQLSNLPTNTGVAG